MPLVVGEQLGPYKIVALIGKGGMGEVYRAFDTQLERDVAIKVLPQALAQDPERLARFDREAKILATLNHPNIAAVYGLAEATGQRALVMEFVSGETLAESLKRGRLRATDALKIARQIAEAVETAHEKGIVHRDLKPGNVMLTPAGTVKVLDFGLATIAQAAPAASGDPAASPTITLGATIAGTILGTASYMSPEQAEGLSADKRSDIWSYGVMLWEMLTGKRLFDASSISLTLADVLRKEIDFDALPRETPPAARSMVRRCLDRDVKNRLRDIGEARVAIDLAGKPAETATEPTRARRPFAWIAATVVFALALGGLAWIHFRETQPARQHVRFQITPPEGNLVYFRLSPDGRYLLLATLEGTTAKLWIRQLASLETRLLTSVAGVNPYPFWSADGEYVGFSASGKIYKIARSGGPATAICDFVGSLFSQGDWRSDGTILFGSAFGLYRVSSAGGTPSRVGGMMNPASPVWLSRDNFLFSMPTGIFAGTLASANSKPLLPDRSNAVFVPPMKSGAPAYFLFLRDSTLMGQPIDADKAELRGEAFPVAEAVGNFGDPLRGAFSASASGVLVYGGGNSASRELVWMDRTGKKLQTVSRRFSLARNPAIRLSPDDTRAIVSVAGAGNSLDLWIADLSRNTLSRFTFDGSTAGIWSPDGRKVLWAARDGNRYLRAADGSGKDELLFKNPTCGACYPEDWSLDGKLIAFTEHTEKTQFDIWLVGTDGGREPYPYVQSRFNETWAQISPDGRWMAYGSDQSGQTEIVVESIPAGKGRWQISTEGGDWAEWRRDGKELFFLQGTKLMAAPIRLTESSVEAGKPQALFEVPPGTRFQVSRDGQRFLIAVPAEGTEAAAPLSVDTDWRAEIGR